jgi:hypothetical protein
LTCDVPSHLYSFSFRPWRWSRRFPPREEILAYLHALVAERGLGPHLRFGCGAEVDMTYTRWPRMWHDFALQPGLLAAADSALAQASWFVSKVTARW